MGLQVVGQDVEVGHVENQVGDLQVDQVVDVVVDVRKNSFEQQVRV
jgi:hypothetical protein